MALTEITWRDVLQLPDDGKRYEAIDGELHVSPAPSLLHQAVSLRLTLALHDILVRDGHGTLWVAPVGVEFPATGKGVQPDLVFVSAARAVEVWGFGDEPRHERFTGRLPVRLAGHRLGEIDLDDVFRRG